MPSRHHQSGSDESRTARGADAGRTGRWWVRVGAAMVGVSLGIAGGAAGGTEAEDLAYEARWKPFLGEYCTGCHGVEKQKGDLDLERLPEQGRFVATNREVWEKVRDALVAREMPPEGKPQPSEADRQSAVRYLEAELGRLDAALPPTPGRVTLRRLNRNEYRNTVRDLLGIDYNAQAEFPNDESGYGFDNIGDVLSLPPMLMEKYLAAAEEIARQAVANSSQGQRRAKRVSGDSFRTQADAVSLVEEDVWAFYREGEIVTEQTLTRAGEYRLRLRVYGEQAGPELPKIGVRVDDRERWVSPVRALAEKPEVLEIPVSLEAGRHRFGVSYLNNFNADGDRNLFLAGFEIAGPAGAAESAAEEAGQPWTPGGRPSVGQEVATAERVLRWLATRAYRRPVTDGEVGRLVRLVELGMADGGGYDAGLRLAVQAVLVSPHFLFRWELDPTGQGPGGGTRDLTDYELASRLSYFLWSSMPDAALFASAARGELRRPAVLEAQVRRMLTDERSQALVQNFGGQWLQVRNLDQVEPDATVFPGWGSELREAMRRETELFLSAVVREDRGIRDLVSADFTYLNERLARHYGIAGVDGAEFRRVQLPAGSPRGGVVTMGSVLTITSVPTRTAPVLRGKWILEQILGTPPPPPPPNVPPVETGSEAAKAATLRQRLEMHRSKPDCIACHQKMDPLGFALENFDAIGAWRDQDGPHPIDNAAELPGGRRFSGAEGLKEILAKSEDFPRALAAKLLTFALGRGLEFHDRRVVKHIVDEAGRNEFKFSAMVLAVVRSDPFLKRQTDTSSHEQHASTHP